MSFWKKILGFKDESLADTGPKLLGEDDYKGYIISAFEMNSGEEFQLCGRIEKEINGELRIKDFIRADKLSSTQEALRFAHKKGRQIIDEQGDALFDNQHC